MLLTPGLYYFLSIISHTLDVSSSVDERGPDVQRCVEGDVGRRSQSGDVENDAMTMMRRCRLTEL